MHKNKQLSGKVGGKDGALHAANTYITSEGKNDRAGGWIKGRSRKRGSWAVSGCRMRVRVHCRGRWILRVVDVAHTMQNCRLRFLDLKDETRFIFDAYETFFFAE